MRFIADHSRDVVAVEIQCPDCRADFWVEMSGAQFHEWYYDSTRRHVQDVFPDHSESDRELLLTGICKQCWAVLTAFGEDE